MVTGNLLANDSDPEALDITLVSTTPPANGTLTTDAKGNFKYTPFANFAGIDTFTYTIVDKQGLSDTATVTLNFTAVNDVDARNDVFAGKEETLLVVTAPGVLANDIDPEGNPITKATLVSGPANDTIVFNADGSFTYTPNANFAGRRHFHLHGARQPRRHRHRHRHHQRCRRER